MYNQLNVYKMLHVLVEFKRHIKNRINASEEKPFDYQKSCNSFGASNPFLIGGYNFLV